MRKITMLNRISIDGYFASLNEATWGMDWFVQDPEVDKAVHETGNTTAILLMGGTTYRGFERSWVPMLHNPEVPPALKATAEELTRLTKVVFSTTLKPGEITWDNTRLFNGNLIKEVKTLKREAEGDLLILGSGTIVQQLAQEGLIDNYLFILSPVVAGGGKPLFKEVKQFGLKLVSTKAFASGNVVLHYRTSQA